MAKRAEEFFCPPEAHYKNAGRRAKRLTNYIVSIKPIRSSGMASALAGVMKVVVNAVITRINFIRMDTSLCSGRATAKPRFQVADE